VVQKRVDVTRLVHDASGRASGALVRDAIDGGEHEISARVIVGAAGPWTDRLRSLDGDESRAAVRGTKGVHIAFGHGRVGNHGAVVLLAPHDGRVMFVLPSDTGTIIGTTDTPSAADADEVRASRGDVQYLLDAANAYFPRASLTAQDVVSAWAGLRPLAASGFTGAPASASREHVIAAGRSGIVWITGGKLTTFRAMAAEAVDAAERRLGRAPRPSPTPGVPLAGGALPDLRETIDEATAITGDAEIATHLVLTHGSAWREVWRLAERDSSGTARLVDELPYVVGELAYAVDHEMALTLGDLLIRRTRVAFETTDHGRAAAAAVAGIVAPRLGWNTERCVRETADYAREVARLFSIDEA
jgi:glycerol-3-phosphate dehydrogenase